VKIRLAIVSATALALLALPSAAEAAGVFAVPQKQCYYSGQKVTFGGNGFSPNGSVRVTSDGTQIGVLSTDVNGAFSGILTVGQTKGQKVKAYAATDLANPTLVGSLNLTVSALDVNVRPRSGRPGRRLRINARGFAGNRNLYAHVLRGHTRRNVRVGRLKGDCGLLKKRKRVFSNGARSGTYTVQFDGKRHYSKKTKQRVRFRVFVFRRVRTSAASAAGVSWTRLP
jgi:hypothetical protein